MITVLIADDYQIVRLGLTHIIEEQKDMIVLEKASNGKEAIEKAANYKPDVIIMDIHMPEMNGIEATRKLKKMNEDVKVIILTMNDKEELFLESLKAGALGYLLKSDDDNDLINAIRTVKDGKIYLKQKDMKRLLDNYVRIADGKANNAFVLDK